MSRVLIVDDDRSIRELLRYALECEGYEVTTLCDGARVVEMLEERPDACIVLMDLMMPYVDGWEVCRQLHQRAGTLPPYHLALMTASGLPADQCPSEVHVLVRKPFELDKVLQLMTVLSSFGAEVPAPFVVDYLHPVGAS